VQDVVQFGPLGSTLFGQVLDDPFFVPQIFKHVGIPPMLDWAKHFAALGSYTLLDKVRSGKFSHVPSNTEHLTIYMGLNPGSLQGRIGALQC